MSNARKGRNNPLLQSTTRDEIVEQTEEVSSPPIVTPQSTPAPPSPVQPPSHTIPLPQGPTVRRRRFRSGLKFTDVYETRSLSIDKRLLPYFDDFMESGDTKTQVANQLVLKILLEAGYAVDPQILTKPIIKPE